MPRRVVDKDLGWKALKRRIVQLGDLRLEVGIFDPNEERLAFAALVNEFGTRDGRIPERPAWRTAIDANTKKYDRILAKGAELVMNGRISPTRVLENLGEVVVRDIRNTIRVWVSPPNAPETIRNKDRNDPLVDTGKTMDLITYRVVRT